MNLQDESLESMTESNNSPVIIGLRSELGSLSRLRYKTLTRQNYDETGRVVKSRVRAFGALAGEQLGIH